MQDARSISALGLGALVGALCALLSMSAGLLSLRVGIWLFTLSLGIYGVVLGVGRWLDHQVDELRQSSRRAKPS
jgi:hypothetical protein